MKVQITGEIFYYQAFGGVSRYIVELVNGLQAAQLCSPQIGGIVSINQYLHEQRHAIDFRGFHVKSAGRILRRLDSLHRWMRQTIARERFDILHASYYSHEHLRRGRGLKIATFYDMIDERMGTNPQTQARKRRTFEQVDHCIAISEFTKSDMIDFYNADPNRISVIPLACSLIPADSKNPDRASTAPFVMWVGNRSGYKNFASFAKAFAVSRFGRSQGEIVLVGGPPMTREEIVSLQSLGIDDRSVTRLEPDDRTLAGLYRDARLLVYSSMLEGFGIPPLEAMTCGCPVVVSRSASLPEVVGDAGIQVDHDDVDAIAAAIDEMTYDSTARDQQIQQGRRRANEFSWQRTARMTFDVYQRQTSGSQPTSGVKIDSSIDK